MADQKTWALVIGLQPVLVVAAGGCQTSLGEACGDGFCTEGEVCLASGSASPVCVRSICGNGHVEQGEECDDGNTRDGDGCSSKCMLEAAPAPDLAESCTDIAASPDGPHDDGEYVLYFGRDPKKPWMAYCLSMASGAGKEYLSLTSAAGNFSQYTSLGTIVGANVRTDFTKVRIDPITLLVLTQDLTYSTSTDSRAGSEPGAANPYAYAASCDDRPSGVANVDLEGTPFVISHDQFTSIGFLAAGTATFSANDQVVDLVGGGYCGAYTTPHPELQLIYP